MLTIDQVKAVGIPKNASRLNNKKFLDVTIPNNSVNLYEAITTVLEQGNTNVDLDVTYHASTIELAGQTVEGATTSSAGVMTAELKQILDNANIIIGAEATDNLGVFAGVTIPDNTDIRSALQALELAVETANGGDGIYGGSGTIQDNTSATIVSNGVFFINFSNENAGFGIVDEDTTTFISSADANYSVYASNDLVGITTPDSTVRVTTGVGINGFPNPALALDVISTVKAFAPPRMTESQRDAVASPVAGSIIYNTDANKLNLYTGAT